jgi:snRNA-activating protein complex subunit 3
MRHYSAVDYSKPILDWLNESSDEVAEKWDAISSGALKKRQKDLLRGLNISNVPEFKSAKMQSTNFSDLHFRLGAGYLYCHQVPICWCLVSNSTCCPNGFLYYILYVQSNAH